MFSSSSISLFSANVSTTYTQLTNGDTQNRALIAMYTRLANYVQNIQMLFTQYSQGNFFAVANILTLNVYNQYSIGIKGLEANASVYPDYEKLRLGTVAALQGLYQSIQQYANLVDTEAKLENAAQYEIILGDPDKLYEYIKTLNLKTAIFPLSEVTIQPAILKAEYAKYIELYGFPPGGVFEMDKLAAILNN